MTEPTKTLTEPFDPRPFRTRPRVAIMVAIYLLAIVFGILTIGTAADAASSKARKPATVEIPNEPEDATGKLSDALRELGATASCPGECLRYVDANGRTFFFRFNP